MTRKATSTSLSTRAAPCAAAPSFWRRTILRSSGSLAQRGTRTVRIDRVPATPNPSSARAETERAALGLSIGVLNETTNAMVVLLAVCSDLAAAPLLRWSAAGAGIVPLPEPEVGPSSVPISAGRRVDTTMPSQ